MAIDHAGVARAAGLAPSVRFNPVLLKPGSDRTSQLVVRGRPVGTISSGDYIAHRDELRAVITEIAALNGALLEQSLVLTSHGVAPLVEALGLDLGSAAVDTYGVPGVERVVLRELTVLSRATLGQAITWTGPDLSAQLDSGLGLLVRQQGVVTAFRLDLTITGRKRPMRLDIRVPNHWCFDRRVNADLVREYLLEAGFMSLPKADLALTA